MRDGEKLPNDQAEMVLSVEAVEWIARNIEESAWDGFLDDLVVLFTRPWGEHPLSNLGGASRLAGLNTATTLGGDHRIVFRVSVSDRGTGLIEVIAIGLRRNNRIYDSDSALLSVARSSDPERVLRARRWPRCDAWMPIARAPCIRPHGHPGAHRSTY